MPLARAYAFIDESGQRASTAASSDHFVMSAVIVRPNRLPRATDLLANIRSELNRGPDHELHWRKFKRHAQKVKAAQMIGESSFLTICSVVVSKRDFEGSRLDDEDLAYMYTFRYLLERVSWWSRDMNVVTEYTLAHVIRFKLASLRKYEAKLRADTECRIDWTHLDPKGGRLNSPKELEYLQLADMTVSATAEAFEPLELGVTESRYLEELRPRLYCPPGGALTSYGLKIHPWNGRSKHRHPWLLSW